MAEPRPCSICSHPSRLAIEQALVNGKGLRPVARDFGIGSGTPGTDTFRPDHKKVERHIGHMAEAYHAAREAGEVESGTALAQRLDYLDEVTTETIERLRAGEVVFHDGVEVLNPDGSARRRWKDTPLLMAVNEARHNLELRHKLAGALDGGNGDAVDQARKALDNPTTRRMLAEVEAELARADQGSSGV